MAKIVRAFPVLPGREDVLAEFIESMKARPEEAAEFFSKYGVRGESWHVQTTPEGTLVIVTTELDDEEAFDRYAEADSEFDRWFKDQVKQVSGIDVNLAPKGAPSEEAYCWRCEASQSE